MLKTSHYLRKTLDPLVSEIDNPFTGLKMPVVFSDDAKFPEKSDVYLASPQYDDSDKDLQLKLCLRFSDLKKEPTQKDRSQVLDTAKRLQIGGYQVSSKLQDWLISRQRYWGTPIPLIHCSNCGTVPVPDEDLPVRLPEKSSLSQNQDEFLQTKCPKCGDLNAKRESDTMDTFVDSSWYYLRYLDPHNTKKIFDKKLTDKYMPVDLYIGGKEHAVLHLYYARFIHHFLYSQGLVPTSEPFSRLLVQGMVMGRSYRVKGTGRYLQEHDVIFALKI